MKTRNLMSALPALVALATTAAAGGPVPQPGVPAALASSEDQARRPARTSPGDAAPVLLGEVTLTAAVTAALFRSPILAAREAAILAADERISQAGLPPNPELEIEAENFAGGGDLRDFDAAETTFLLSQPLELGGKRGRRKNLARADRALVARDSEGARLDVIAGTTADLYRLLAAQERFALARELLTVSERLLETVIARVAAGKVSPVEAARARVPATTTRIELEAARRRLDGARALLAANWGADSPRFDRASGDLASIVFPPPLEGLRSAALATPDVLRWHDEEERRQVVLRLERSMRAPDLKLSAGSRRFEETGRHAWVGGLSLELPLFNTNHGAIRAAELDAAGARWQRRAAEIRLLADVDAARCRLIAVHAEVRLLGHEAVPAASEAFTAVETGYREGKLGLVQLLDAQRLLFETRLRHIEALETYHLTRVNLERLVGMPIHLIANGTPPVPAPGQSG